jgi:cell division protease FtsH
VEGNDPLHKVTIIPRGRALGLTMNLPERDRYGFKKTEVTARLAMMFGGRAAEELIYGPENVTTGAGNDIQQATALARRMVTEWGMSDELGPLRYDENQEEIFLGHSIARSQHISEATAQKIDEEIRRIIHEAEQTATKVLKKHLKDLHKVAKGLLEYETLSADEVQTVLRDEPVDRSEAEGEGPGGGRSSVPSSGKAAKGKDSPGGMEPELQPEG